MSDPAGRVEARALILHEQRLLRAVLEREVVAVPDVQRAWMLAPHPDDDLFGAGGTTLKLRAAGRTVRWVCLTDGRACVSGRAERAAMAARRAAEEVACARAAGAELQWLGVPEDRLTEPDRAAALVATLRASLEELAPDAVFTPWCLEPHPLHRYATALLARALESVAWPCAVHSYAVTSFPPPRRIVDIGDVFERKRALVALYRSQVERHDYAADCEALARFGAAWAGAPVTLAEVFLVQPREEFVREVLALGLDHEETLRVGTQPLQPEEPPA